jgi:serine/threonine protein kinase
MPLQQPEKIDKYQILSVIGKGAMGVVYHAYDPVVKRDVAVKLLSALDIDEPELISRFEREARLAGGLRHPNIVTIYDLGHFEGRPYIAMEYIVGQDLEQVIKSKQPLPIEKKVEIILQICKGLYAAHQKGIIHRDIKPANIRLQEDDTVRIMDFGIARMGTSKLTKSGYIIGTLQYMSPEQISGEPLDARTDLFSTGVMAYEFFTHTNPFAGGGAVDIMYRILNVRPSPIHDLPEEYSTELNQIVMRALEKNRNLRYPSAKEMAQDLEDFLFYLKTMKFQSKVSPKVANYEEGRTQVIMPEDLPPSAIQAKPDPQPAVRASETMISKPQVPPGVVDIRNQHFPTFGLAQTDLEPAPRTGLGANYSETAQQVLMKPADTHGKAFYILGALIALLFIGGLVYFAKFQKSGKGLPVNSTPTGAEVWADGTYLGATPFSIKDKRDLAITFKLKGYLDKEVLLSREAWPSEVNVTLEPAATIPDSGPTARMLKIESTPPGAELTLDGESAGMTPAEINVSNDKPHELIAELEGYQDIKQTIDNTTTSPVDLQFEPTIQPGSVRYSGRYRISIINQGKTLKGNPVELSPGAYTLTFKSRQNAYITFTRKVEIESGKTITIQEPAMGKLTVKAAPSNCKVYLNGDYLDDVPIFGFPVQAGTHVVQFTWPALGKKLSTRISISANDTQTVVGDLKDAE